MKDNIIFLFTTDELRADVKNHLEGWFDQRSEEELNKLTDEVLSSESFMQEIEQLVGGSINWENYIEAINDRIADVLPEVGSLDELIEEVQND